MSQAAQGFTTKNSFVYLKSSGTGCPAFLFAEPGTFHPGWGGSSRVGRLCAFSLKGWRSPKGLSAGGGFQLLSQAKFSGWKIRLPTGRVCGRTEQVLRDKLRSFLRTFRGEHICKQSTSSILINNVNSDYLLSAYYVKGTLLGVYMNNSQSSQRLYKAGASNCILQMRKHRL